jgi:hypothetical protein
MNRNRGHSSASTANVFLNSTAQRVRAVAGTALLFGSVLRTGCGTILSRYAAACAQKLSISRETSRIVCLRDCVPLARGSSSARDFLPLARRRSGDLARVQLHAGLHG